MEARSEIASVQDAVSEADRLASEGGSALWWRGQCQSTWHLAPSVFREERGVRPEQNIIAAFQARAPSRYDGCPAPSDRAGWLFLLQHYRAPTRLLDWSESVLVALYFAVAEQESTGGALFALSPYQLNMVQIGQSRLLLASYGKAAEMIDAAFTGAQMPEQAIAIAAVEIDVRMLLQQATFTVHSTGGPVEAFPQSDKFLWKLSIPAGAKPRIREQLARLGIRSTTLFPDLEHLAQEVGGMRWVSHASRT